jgi:hypothetical protein
MSWQDTAGTHVQQQKLGLDVTRRQQVDTHHVKLCDSVVQRNRCCLDEEDRRLRAKWPISQPSATLHAALAYRERKIKYVEV